MRSLQRWGAMLSGSSGFSCVAFHRSDSYSRLSPLIDEHRPALSIHVGTKAAPCPLLWFCDQSALHWVAVHVAQLFDALLLVPYVEAVEAALPNVVVFFPEPELR